MDSREMASILADHRGSVMVITIFVIAILLVFMGGSLYVSGLGLRISGNYRTGSQALYGADTGVQVGLNQISANVAASTVGFSGSIGSGVHSATFCSRRRNDPCPQPLEFVGTRPEVEFSLGLGTGYNTSGYVSYLYGMNVTGTAANDSAREIEALAAYGPVPQ